MTLDLAKRQLLHSSGTLMRFESASSSVSGINVVHANSFIRLLSDFLEITDSSLATSTSPHGVECFIDTSGPPIKTSPRRLMPEKLRLAKQYFDLMCAASICRRSNSPWSSGLHMVAKKDGTSRPCGDYRRLNERTAGDAYPIPHIHDLAAGLSGCTVFSKIDLVKGYHQVPVRGEDIPKTAIATPFGLFEFVRMPFGLKNAAQTFQRLMDNVTGQLTGVFTYIDDVLVASPSPRNTSATFGACSTLYAASDWLSTSRSVSSACPLWNFLATTSRPKAFGRWPTKSRRYGGSSARAR